LSVVVAGTVVSYNPSSPHCLHCQRRPPEATFGVRVDTGKTDELCVACRFDVIDGKHADSAAIRDDMRRSGVNVRGAGRTLRFEPGADVRPRIGEVDDDNDE
jgi:hypothetical protein